MVRKVLFTVCIICFLSGCNIFEWTTTTNDDIFYEGMRLFNEKNFSKAREKFARAMEEDPNRSDYRYYHAKSVVFESEINFFKIARDVVAIDTADVVGLSLPLYTRDPELTIEQDNQEKNFIYQVTWMVHDDIRPIYENQTHGEIKADDIFFEFSILSLARSLLQMRDTNNDLSIDYKGLYITITKVLNPRTGEFVYLPNIGEIVDSLNASEQIKQGFNSALINSAVYAVEGLLSLNKTFSDTLYFETEDLDNLIQDIEDMSNFYQIEDGIDNDDDGKIDEETINLLDDDNDGLTDEDPHL